MTIAVVFFIPAVVILSSRGTCCTRRRAAVRGAFPPRRVEDCSFHPPHARRGAAGASSCPALHHRLLCWKRSQAQPSSTGVNRRARGSLGMGRARSRQGTAAFINLSLCMPLPVREKGLKLSPCSALMVIGTAVHRAGAQG